MTWRDEPLFDAPSSPPLKRAKALADKAARGTTTRYRPKNRVPCDECIAVLHEADGVGPYARSARWRAAHKGRVLLLCNEHADAWRTDGTRT